MKSDNGAEFARGFDTPRWVRGREVQSIAGRTVIRRVWQAEKTKTVFVYVTGMDPETG